MIMIWLPILVCMLACWTWVLVGTVRAYIDKNLKLLIVRWTVAALVTGSVYWLWEADRKLVAQFDKDHPDQQLGW